MTLHSQMRPLLAQYTNATGRGNLVVANETLVQIVEKLIEKLDQPPEPCANCQCSGSNVVTLPSLPMPLSEPVSEPIATTTIIADALTSVPPEPVIEVATVNAAEMTPRKPRAQRKSPVKTTTRRKPRTIK